MARTYKSSVVRQVKVASFEGISTQYSIQCRVSTTKGRCRVRPKEWRLRELRPRIDETPSAQRRGHDRGKNGSDNEPNRVNKPRQEIGIRRRCDMHIVDSVLRDKAWDGNVAIWICARCELKCSSGRNRWVLVLVARRSCTMLDVEQRPLVLLSMKLGERRL